MQGILTNGSEVLLKSIVPRIGRDLRNMRGLVFLVYVLSCSTYVVVQSDKNFTIEDTTYKEPRLGRFRNDPCSGGNNLNGTCFTKKECRHFGGTPSGSCANGKGICCIIHKTCGSKSKLNCTYFTNPEYPLSTTGGNRCTITIKKCDSGICQLRLDFLDFTLAQPNASGSCVDDAFAVTGSASVVPLICGDNTNQHLYVDFPAGDGPIQLTVDTSSALLTARKWNIKITQIACNSPDRAPTGCLMYYTAVAGKVMSFNYGQTANPAVVADIPGTRELANLNYGVCVKMAEGYCSIEWRQNPADPFSFTVSGPTDVEVDLLGTPTAALRGPSCLHDFVVIPNPSQNMVPVDSDRFCGNGFVPTTTSSKPFVLTVVTDANENGPPPDRANRGFCLFYRQQPCPL